MNPEYDPDSFYPFRVQEQTGQAEVPVIDPHGKHDHNKSKKGKPSLMVILVSVIAIFFIFVLSYNSYARRRIENSVEPPTPTMLPSNTPTPSFTPTPTQKVPQFSSNELQNAYNQTVAAQTMKAAFVSHVITKNILTSGGESTVDSQVEGYLYGASDGNTIQTELKISYSAQPDKTAFFGQILVDNRLFMKVNDNNWEERNRSDYNKLYENQPIDATAYAYNMLDTLFTNSKALLRGIDDKSVQQLPDDQIDGKVVQVFSFNESIPDYIGSLQNDPKTTPFTLEDAKKILTNATISGKIYVDPSSRYIVRIALTGSNLTQINSDQSHLLGQTTSHTIEMVANLVDFNTPLTLKAPTNQ